ncbi:hypothetical protein F4678DRAFT_464014 [Xylaria arbuscula]|nr:hypothetical protein F4678DRAFT_464014 [Xylaria arbuscula]
MGFFLEMFFSEGFRGLTRPRNNGERKYTPAEEREINDTWREWRRQAELKKEMTPSIFTRCYRKISLPRRLYRILLWILILIFGFWLTCRSAHQLFEEKTVQRQPSQCDFPLQAADPDIRPQEYTNTFATYKHFGEKCGISSQDLHRPFEPICLNRPSSLAAMSSGGRIGRDAVYIPRGCDMQWYTTEQVCEILGQFSQVILVGDSMLRHVIGALNIIVREDLGYGGVTDWNFNARERQGNRSQLKIDGTLLTDVNRERCFCNDQFDVTECSVQGIYKTEDVLKNDRESFACARLVPGWSTDLRIEQMVRYPMEDAELERLEKAIDKNPNSKKAFILGHGLWSDLEVNQSKAWLNTVIKVIDSKLRLRMRFKKKIIRGMNMPILLMTPNAAGEKKPDEFLVNQGNKALVRFEHAMAEEAARLNIDHLGTWNMSIQANLYDGVHMDMRGNLLKAMMVVNWLNQLAGEEDMAKSAAVQAPVRPE